MTGLNDQPLVLALAHTPALRDVFRKGIPGYRVGWLKENYSNPRDAVAQVAEAQPALLVVELDRPADWLHTVRSDPATRRFPVLGIGEDEEAELRALRAKVDNLFTAELFIASLEDLITQYARVYNQAQALHDQCQDEAPPLVLRGLEEFNAGQFFECHETLEQAWMAETAPVRDLYRAILQVAVAYYQILRGNYPGAEKMFLRVAQWFAPLPARCRGIDVAQLRADAAVARAHLLSLGPERIGEFDRSLLRPVIYDGHKDQ